MAKFFTIVAALNFVQFLSVPFRVSASVSHKNTTSWKTLSSFGHSQGFHPTKPQVSKKPELRTSQDWQRSCLQVYSNQTMEEARKEHLAALNQSLSEQFDLNNNVLSTNQGNPRARIRTVRVGKRSITEDDKIEITNKQIFFANVDNVSRKVYQNREATQVVKVIVKRLRNRKGVVVRFLLNGADIPRKLVSVRLWAYNVCNGIAVKPVLIIKLFNERGEKEEKCANRMANLNHNKKLVLDPVNLNAHQEGWLKFNITAPIKAMWKKAKRACKEWRKKNLSLILRSPKCISPSSHETIDGKKLKPYLELMSAENPSEKAGKNSSPLTCTPTEKRCCLQRGQVLLKELGGWTSGIIIPTVIPANFCRGLCSVNSSSSHSPHGITQPCCVPIKTSALSAVYFKSGQISMKNLPDIQVHECGCV